MSKRTFKTRSYGAWDFASRTFGPYGGQSVTADTERIVLLGLSEERHSITGLSEERHTLGGLSEERYTLTGVR